MVCGKDRCKECPEPPLLPEAWPGVAAYTLCATQWRVGGMGGRVGLDYPACKLVIDLHRPRLADVPEAELFEDLQVIESAILRADREISERDRAQRELARHTAAPR